MFLGSQDLPCYFCDKGEEGEEAGSEGKEEEGEAEPGGGGDMGGGGEGEDQVREGEVPLFNLWQDFL